MARKSNAQIKAEAEAEALEKLEAINAGVEKRVTAMLPGLVMEITQKLLAQTGASGAVTSEGAAPQLVEFAKALGVQIAQSADPRQRNKQVSPEVLAGRKKARQEMIDLIVHAKAQHDGGNAEFMPIYKCRGKMFLSDTKIDEEWRDEGTKRFHATEVFWDRIPNQAMIPVNEIAKRIYDLYLRSIGSVEVEGMPEAPWMGGSEPWVQSKDGIVKGRPVAEVAPEYGTKSPFHDPRRTGQAQEPRHQTVHVLGKSAPPVVVER